MSSQDIRLYIYEQFAFTGKAPEIDQIAQFFGLPLEATKEIIQELADSRHIAIDKDHKILMAHPFSSVPLGFAVMGEKTLWWGGCSWDSFALPNLLSQEVVVSTTCPNCFSAFAWRVDPRTPPTGDQLAHFLVPVKQMWTDVVHTCGNQRIFCNERCLDSWLVQSQLEKGYVMNLATLWSLASRWYEGRMGLDYRRREPETAAQYFREAGLSGSFWGLD